MRHFIYCLFLMVFFAVVNFYAQEKKSIKINSIVFTDVNNGWAIAKQKKLYESVGIVLHTIDGGKNWNEWVQPIRQYFYFHSFQSIFFLKDGKTGWISSENGLYKTIDKGKNWEYLPLQFGFDDTPICLRSIFFANDSVGYGLLGLDIFRVTNVRDVLKTTDGGKSWKSCFLDSVNMGIQDMFFLNDKCGWLVGVCHSGGAGIDNYGHFYSRPVYSEAKMYKTSDGGKTWAEQSFNGTSRVGSEQKIFFLDQLNGWVFGNYCIARTYNGGKKWFYFFPSDQFKNQYNLYDNETGFMFSPFSFFFHNPNIGFAVGYDHKKGAIFKTTNGGKIWSIIFSVPNEWLFTVYFVDQNIGWVAGGEIYKTVDGGENWKIIPNAFEQIR